MRHNTIDGDEYSEDFYGFCIFFTGRKRTWDDSIRDGSAHPGTGQSDRVDQMPVLGYNALTSCQTLLYIQPLSGIEELISWLQKWNEILNKLFWLRQVENYAVLPTQRDKWPELQKIEGLRSVEMELDEDLFKPWEEQPVKLSIQEVQVPATSHSQ